MLAFDLGSYDGNDAIFLEKNGYTVIAVEANPIKANNIKEKTKNLNIIVENLAITDTVNTVSFFISTKSVWDSCNKNLAIRLSNEAKEIKVRSTTINDLIYKYGIPEYIKSDIEGNDEIMLKCLSANSIRPKFISCESECLYGFYSKEKTFIVIDLMQKLNYTKFYIEDQYKKNQKILPLNIHSWLTYEQARKKISILAQKDILVYKNPWSVWIDIYCTY